MIGLSWMDGCDSCSKMRGAHAIAILRRMRAAGHSTEDARAPLLRMQLPIIRFTPTMHACKTRREPCNGRKKQRGPANRTPSCVGEPTLLLLLRGLLRCLLGSLLGALLGSFLGRFLRSFLSHGEMGLMPNLASFDHVYATCDVNVAHHPLLKSLER